MLENWKLKSEELRNISEAEFYSLSLEQAVKAIFYLGFKNTAPHPPSLQGLSSAY